MAIWKLCADESYDDNWYIVAGAMATKSQWRSFLSRWKKALAARNPRPIKYFSKKEAGRTHRENSPFYGWTQGEVLEKASALGDLLPMLTVRHATFINRRAFMRLVQMSEFDERYQSEYYLGFFQTLRMAADYMESLPGRQRPPILVYEDLNKKYRTKAREIWQYALRKAPQNEVLRSIGTWIQNEPLWMADHAEPGDNRRVDIGLQAADVIAWHLRRGLQIADEGTLWVPPPFMEQNILTCGHFSHKALEAWRWVVKNMLFEKGSKKDRRTPWPWQEQQRRDVGALL